MSKAHVQNLSWSQEFFLNICNATLRLDLQNRIVSVPRNQQGGTLVFHMIMSQLVSTNMEASRAIINRLQALTLNEFTGQNITNFCSTFNNTVIGLELNGHAPMDLANILLACFRICSVTHFSGWLETLKHTKSPVLEDYTELRLTAMKSYNTLLLTNRWLPTGSSAHLAKIQKALTDTTANSSTTAPGKQKVPDKLPTGLPKDKDGK